MSFQLNAYLNFKDNTRQAMEFYKTVFGGDLVMNTFKEFHAAQDPSDENKIMHAELRGDNGILFMAADTPKSMAYKPVSGFSLSLSGDDETKLKGYYDKLAAGGQVTMPLEKAQWGDMFGMVTDKFGVSWLVNIGAPRA